MTSVTLFFPLNHKLLETIEKVITKLFNETATSEYDDFVYGHLTASVSGIELEETNNGEKKNYIKITDTDFQEYWNEDKMAAFLKPSLNLQPQV